MIFLFSYIQCQRVTSIHVFPSIFALFMLNIFVLLSMITYIKFCIAPFKKLYAVEAILLFLNVLTMNVWHLFIKENNPFLRKYVLYF